MCGGRVGYFQPPKVTTLNPIGRGDCVTARSAVGWLKGRRLPEAVALGIACGTANAASLTPATFDPRVLPRLRPVSNQEGRIGCS